MDAAHDDAARRELLSGFNVRVTLFPARAEVRVRITGADLWAHTASLILTKH